MENRFIEGRVSVITPVYNAERYLREMLESVYQQGYSDIEIVLVDDQSSDNSAMIIQDEMKNHSEILYSLQPQNMGAGVARNKAMELAKEKVLLSLDEKDEILTEKVLQKSINDSIMNIDIFITTKENIATLS